ncbi:MAG: hypothetical protein RR877_00840 [Aurantimicrobium sp.]|uniref:hypothetical protein n=1 Tax=Aurantimicrobium sp. TaxID=1930784 RepID=UPI002FCC49EC
MSTPEKTNQPLHPVVVLMAVAAVILGVTAIIGTAMEIFPLGSRPPVKTELQRELEKDDCTLLSEAPTGKQFYCGKACWKKEIRIEYQCKSGIKVIIK